MTREELERELDRCAEGGLSSAEESALRLRVGGDRELQALLDAESRLSHALRADAGSIPGGSVVPPPSLSALVSATPASTTVTGTAAAGAAASAGATSGSGLIAWGVAITVVLGGGATWWLATGSNDASSRPAGESALRTIDIVPPLVPPPPPRSIPPSTPSRSAARSSDGMVPASGSSKGRRGEVAIAPTVIPQGAQSEPKVERHREEPKQIPEIVNPKATMPPAR